MLAVKSSILCYFVAVILKVLLVNLLAALNFANVFLNKKRLEKNVKNVKNVTKIVFKKPKKRFYIYVCLYVWWAHRCVCKNG